MTLGPIHYAIFAAGLTLGGITAGAGSWAWTTLVANPSLVRETKAGCQAEAENAASRARLEQWRRNQEVIDKLNADFAEITRRRTAEQAQIDRETDDEIAAFEAAGISTCAVTVDNLDFLQPPSLRR